MSGSYNPEGTCTYIVCPISTMHIVLLRVALLWLHNESYMMTSSNGDIFRVTGPLWGEFTGHRQWRGALMFSLICASTKGRGNYGDPGDLRRHRAYHDVTVMCTLRWYFYSHSALQVTLNDMGNIDWYLITSKVTTTTKTLICAYSRA